MIDEKVIQQHLQSAAADLMEPTFHLFPRLPYELRAYIWELTVEPRIVPVSCWIGDGRATEINSSGSQCRRDLNREVPAKPPSRKYHTAAATALPRVAFAVSPTKPGVIDACRESREMDLYEKLILEPGSAKSYAWVNFDIDTIDIGDASRHAYFKRCAHKIRRLKFNADISNGSGSYSTAGGIVHFDNLLECFVVTKDRFLDWARAEDRRAGWPCKPESTFIIKDGTGQMKCCADLNRWWMQEKQRTQCM